MKLRQVKNHFLNDVTTRDMFTKLTHDAVFSQVLVAWSLEGYEYFCNDAIAPKIFQS